MIIPGKPHIYWSRTGHNWVCGMDWRWASSTTPAKAYARWTDCNQRWWRHDTRVPIRCEPSKELH